MVVNKDIVNIYNALYATYKYNVLYLINIFYILLSTPDLYTL